MHLLEACRLLNWPPKEACWSTGNSQMGTFMQSHPPSLPIRPLPSTMAAQNIIDRYTANHHLFSNYRYIFTNTGFIIYFSRIEIIIFENLFFRKCGLPELRRSGNPEIPKSGLSELRISGILEFRKSGNCGNPCFQTSGSPEVRSSGDPEFRKSGFPKIPISGLQIVSGNSFQLQTQISLFRNRFCNVFVAHGIHFIFGPGANASDQETSWAIGQWSRRVPDQETHANEACREVETTLVAQPWWHRMVWQDSCSLSYRDGNLLAKTTFPFQWFRA